MWAWKQKFLQSELNLMCLSLMNLSKAAFILPVEYYPSRQPDTTLFTIYRYRYSHKFILNPIAYS